MDMDSKSIIEYLPQMALEDVQAILQAANSECLERINARRSTCKHPEEHRGMLAIERGPNIVPGCTYCVSPVYGEDAA